MRAPSSLTDSPLRPHCAAARHGPLLARGSVPMQLFKFICLQVCASDAMRPGHAVRPSEEYKGVANGSLFVQPRAYFKSVTSSYSSSDGVLESKGTTSERLRMPRWVFDTVAGDSKAQIVEKLHISGDAQDQLLGAQALGELFALTAGESIPETTSQVEAANDTSHASLISETVNEGRGQRLKEFRRGLHKVTVVVLCAPFLLMTVWCTMGCIFEQFQRRRREALSLRSLSNHTCNFVCAHWNLTVLYYVIATMWLIWYLLILMRTQHMDKYEDEGR